MPFPHNALPFRPPAKTTRDDHDDEQLIGRKTRDQKPEEFVFARAAATAAAAAAGIQCSSSATVYTGQSAPVAFPRNTVVVFVVVVCV